VQLIVIQSQALPQAQVPTVIIAPTHNVPMSSYSGMRSMNYATYEPRTSSAVGASVLISNLNNNISESDIIELFEEIGTVSAVTMVNPTTAMVTFVDGRDASTACQTYHNRLLDGMPMQCNVIPQPGVASAPRDVRSRLQPQSNPHPNRLRAADMFASDNKRKNVQFTVKI